MDFRSGQLFFDDFPVDLDSDDLAPAFLVAVAGPFFGEPAFLAVIFLAGF